MSVAFCPRFGAIVCCAALWATSATAASFDKPSILGNPDLFLQKAQKLDFGLPNQSTRVPTLGTTQQPAIKVLNTQIGLYNPTSSDVAAVVDMGNGQPRVVLLKAHQIETIDCASCGAAVHAIVPSGSKPVPGDFSLPLTKGSVYQFEYDTMTKRWVLVRK